MTTTYQVPVMPSPDVNPSAFPDHANVLAVVVAYQEQYGPMPWPLLLDVMASLPSINSPLTLSTAGARVEEALVDIITDLRALGLVVMTSRGTIQTEAAREQIRVWNGQFSGRCTGARQALEALRFGATSHAR